MIFGKDTLSVNRRFATQRRNKKELSKERRTRLNKVGFVWNAPMGPPIAYRPKMSPAQRRSIISAKPTAQFHHNSVIRANRRTAGLVTGNVLFRS